MTASILPELASGRVVEGEAVKDSSHQAGDHPVQILEQLDRWHSPSRDPMAGDERVPIRIAVRPVAPVMRLAVDLDVEPGIVTVEVERYVFADRMLPAKL